MSNLDYNYFLSNNGHPTQRKGWTHNVQGRCDLARALARRRGRRSRRGAFALFMGNFGRGYVHDQLVQEKITMPVAAAMDGLPQADKDALLPFAGQPLDSGKKAQAYANNYILVHMREACDAVTSADSKTKFDAVPADQCTYAGIGAIARNDRVKADPAALAAYNALRTSNFQDDMLRGALLNTYGWSILATIGFYAGIGLLVLGVLLGAFGLIKPKRTTA